MNIFLFQSLQTRIELEEIADVRKQIISPASGVPIIGIVQDGLIGAYNLTQPSMMIDWKDAMNIISYTTMDDFSAFKKKDLTGSELFSLIMPPRLNLSGSVDVQDSQLKKGILSKSSIGGGKNTIIHTIWDQYGYQATKDFIDNTTKMINHFNMMNGFTVGIGDIALSRDLEEQLHKMFETKKLEISHMITEMENNPDLFDTEIFEESIKADLAATGENSAKLFIANLKPTNNFMIMMNCGSKGSPTNMAQMACCLGQQQIEGKRPAKKVNGRPLPYFHQNDDTAIARGFVQQPFVRGASAIGFMFHNMGSREGLIDTSIKSVTAETRIIILENGNIKNTQIGEWIDDRLNNDKDKVEHYVEQEMELLKLNDSVFIPTTDERGNVSWGEITAITRHDPGKELYEVKTLGGRSVIVTESKSLLIWNNGAQEYQMKHTPLVKVGDYMPVTMKLTEPPVKHNNNFIMYHDDQIRDKFDFTYNGGFKLGETLNSYNNEYFWRETLNQSINTPIEFIDGLLNGFENNNGRTLLKNMTFGYEIIVYLSMIYNRKGIYTLIKKNNIDKYALEFNTDVIIKNDTVMDAIISITKVDVSKYPKVYDLTVPSTLNFGLANGLHVVDTAESGYLQRKLIKSMEDAMIKYDCTVRNANNTVIQFVYGDSGVDTTKQYTHKLSFLEMGNVEIANRCKFNEQEIKNFNSYREMNDELYNDIIQLRNDLRIIKMKVSLNNITFDSDFMLPVNLKNLVNYSQTYKSTDGGKLTPEYVLERLNDILIYDNTKITAISDVDRKNAKSLKFRDEILCKTAFKLALYEYFGPKQCIMNYKLDKKTFDEACEIIIHTFNGAIVEPGEMVGILASQSIGEPLTQLTLNSIDWNDEIVLMDNNEFRIVKIGEYIDHKIKSSDNVQRPADHNEMANTYYLDTSKDNVYTISVNEDGKLSWNKINALTKHLPINTDGTNDLVKVTTRLGRCVTATKAKSFLTRVDNKIVAIRGDEIKVGMKLPIAVNHPKFDEKNVCDSLIKCNEEPTIGDIYMDDIVLIEIVKPTNTYVYDLTVENDLTFVVGSGILMEDEKVVFKCLI